MKNQWIPALLVFLILIIFTAACSPGTTNPQPASTAALDGAALLQERCTVCHPLSYVERTKHTSTDWKLIVDVMISRGAKLTSEEETFLVDFLSASFGK